MCNPGIQFDRNESIYYDLGQIFYTSFPVYPTDTVSQSFPSNDMPSFGRYAGLNIEAIFL